MLTPEMYAGMTGSVLQHAQGHIQKALSLCDAIGQGDGTLQERLQDAQDLITEIKVIKSDMERALLFLDMDSCE
jgi:hypothetical protein